MLKHIFIIFTILFAMPCFADIGATNGVPNAATCDSGALGSESGGVALQVQYVPETIALQWYDNNTLLDVTSTSSDSCTYNTSINLPDNPTKTGYKFTGWKVRPLYDFSTLDTSANGNIGYAKDSTKCGVTVLDGSFYEDCNENHTDLSVGEWKTSFDFGTVYGMAICDSAIGTYTYSGTLTNNEGFQCWCKVTGYVQNNTNVKYASQNVLSWIYCYDAEDVTKCNRNCARRCSNAIMKNSNFRSASFRRSN